MYHSARSACMHIYQLVMYNTHPLHAPRRIPSSIAHVSHVLSFILVPWYLCGGSYYSFILSGRCYASGERVYSCSVPLSV